MDLPPRARAWVLGVEVAAVAAPLISAVATVGGAPPPQAIGLAALLAVLSVAHTELATGIERARRRVAQSSYFDLSSVWTFAGALLLPAPLAAAVVVVVYAHLWQRVWRPSGVPLHRHVYTTATVVLAATAAHEVVTGAGGLPVGPGGRGRSAGRRRRGARLRRGEHRAHRGGDRAVPARDRRPGAHGALGRQRAGDRHAVPGRARRRGARWRAVPRGARAAADPRAAPGRAGAPPGGGGEPRRQDRAAQRGHLAGPAPSAPPRTRAGPAAVRACSSSTSTTSRRSTTSTATSRATTCSRRSPGPCGRRCAARTSSAGSAGRSSWCSSAALPRGRAGRVELAAVARAAAQAGRRGSPCPPAAAP